MKTNRAKKNRRALFLRENVDSAPTIAQRGATSAVRAGRTDEGAGDETARCGSAGSVRLLAGEGLERPGTGAKGEGSSAAQCGEAAKLFHHRFASDLARDRVDQLRVVDRVAAAARRIDSEGLGEAFNILETSASEERWVEQHIGPRKYSRSSLLSREFLGWLDLGTEPPRKSARSSTVVLGELFFKTAERFDATVPLTHDPREQMRLRTLEQSVHQSVNASQLAPADDSGRLSLGLLS
jgi:hypothetical protein